MNQEYFFTYFMYRFKNIQILSLLNFFIGGIFFLQWIKFINDYRVFQVLYFFVVWSLKNYIFLEMYLFMFSNLVQKLYICWPGKLVSYLQIFKSPSAPPNPVPQSNSQLHIRPPSAVSLPLLPRLKCITQIFPSKLPCLHSLLISVLNTSRHSLGSRQSACQRNK